MKTLATALFSLLAASCANTPANMSPEQLKALIADKNASAACSTVAGVWGTGKVVVVNLDETRSTNGTISVNADCVVTMTTTGPVKPVAAPAPPAPPAP